LKKQLNILLPPLLFLLIVGTAVLVMPLQRASEKRGDKMSAEESSHQATLLEEDYLFSPYDKMFRRICRRHNVDWVLMAAIAYGESNFRHDAVSPRGAVGLMQVMPRIARSFGVEREMLFDPETNIDVAARLYKSMEKILRLPSSVSKRDRMAMTLASYNCGCSHIIDARNLAEYYGDDADSWEVVTEYLSLLSEEEFSTHEAVDYGEFVESDITIAYVNKVLRRYDHYRDIKKKSKRI
jgi:membrane-bound lytic murein transglycosylase F